MRESNIPDNLPKTYLALEETACMDCKHVGLERVRVVKVDDNNKPSGHRSIPIFDIVAICPVESCRFIHQWDRKLYGIRHK